MGNLTSGLAALLIAVGSAHAADGSAIDSWSLTGLKAQIVPAIWIAEGSEFARHVPSDGAGFLEVRGRLRVPPGARFDPVVLAEIRVRNAAGERPQELVTFGASIAMCRYVAREVSRQDVSTMTVAKGSRLSASRDSPDAPRKLRWEGEDGDLCFAFPAVARVGDELLLEFAGGSFTVPVIEQAAAATKAADAGEQASSKPWERLRSTSRAVWAIAAAGLLLLGSGVFVAWSWRQRRTAVPASSPVSVPVPAGPFLAAASVKASDVDIRLAGSDAEQEKLAEPGRVSTLHCRTTFAPMAKNAGPGKADFDAALRMLLGEEFCAADALLVQAMTKGLAPAFECGAWALRGQAAVARGQMQLAIRCFLNALGGEEVTLQAALPAAMHLAVIYRALKLRADAEKMEAVAKAINRVGVTLDAEAVSVILQHAQAYRNALREKRPSWLRRLLGRLFQRSTSTAAS